jgi:hypothetical protein
MAALRITPPAACTTEVKMTDWLRRNLTEVFELPAAAVGWLCDLYEAIQTFDDYQDGDPVSREALHALIWTVLVAMPQNPFFKAHSELLLPLVANAVLKWHGANIAEQEKTHNATSFVWRAGYYDLVLMVVAICKGHQYAALNANAVMQLYGEKFEDYLKEINNA